MDREVREHITRMGADDAYLLDLFVGRGWRRRLLRLLTRAAGLLCGLIAKEADK